MEKTEQKGIGCAGGRSQSVSRCPINYQNNLWEAIQGKNYNRLVYLTDRWTDSIWYHFSLPKWGEFVTRVFRSCLQTILYSSVLGKQVLLDNGLKIDLESLDGSTSFYWAVVNRSNVCVPNLELKELKVEPGMKRIVQHLVQKLLKSDHFKPTLVDGLPILHILLSIGHRYERPDQSVDLFELYISRHPDQANLTCPWTERSTLELLQSKKQKLKKSVSYMEDQVQNCITRTGGSSPTKESLLPRTHIPGHEEIGWEKRQKGIIQLRETLALWRSDESAFRKKLTSSVMTFSGEADTSTQGKVINGVLNWLRSCLEEKNSNFKYGLKMSGSVGENTKILPMDELDLVLQVWLDVEVEVKSLKMDDFVKIRKELSRPIGKQPAKHLVRLVLRKAYPHLGEVGDELNPHRFGKVADWFISHLLKDAKLPSWLRCPEGKSIVMAPDLVERTKAGLMLNLEYLEKESGQWQELSIDLVAVLVLTKDQREKYLKHIPERDRKRNKLLSRENLISECDGLVAKKGQWRSSFSFSERNLIALHPELYQALKYLNKVSENHIDIPTYLLKEIFCSYITSSMSACSRDQNETLAMSLARLIHYAKAHPIATPFYGTKLGGQISSGCRNLFKDFQSKFEDEFEVIKKEEERSASANISKEGWRYLTQWAEQAGHLDCKREDVKEMGINALIKNINGHFNI